MLKFLMLFSYDCSLKLSFLFVWILLLSRTVQHHCKVWDVFMSHPVFIKFQIFTVKEAVNPHSWADQGKIWQEWAEHAVPPVTRNQQHRLLWGTAITTWPCNLQHTCIILLPQGNTSLCVNIVQKITIIYCKKAQIPQFEILYFIVAQIKIWTWVPDYKMSPIYLQNFFKMIMAY